MSYELSKRNFDAHTDHIWLIAFENFYEVIDRETPMIDRELTNVKSHIIVLRNLKIFISETIRLPHARVVSSSAALRQHAWHG